MRTHGYDKTLRSSMERDHLEPQLISQSQRAAKDSCFHFRPIPFVYASHLLSPYLIYGRGERGTIESKWTAGNVPQMPLGAIRNPTILQAHHNTRFPASGVKRSTSELHLRRTERIHVRIWRVTPRCGMFIAYGRHENEKQTSDPTPYNLLWYLRQTTKPFTNGVG